ncbi:hypothetical protein GALL_199400 [mine drainage metagenome]|uniref:DUF883 domain-containing protein n=1 Tax=mine drainage metagenome TaxID=410659 RepID=A0A1J5S8B6_9ZZZZ
MTTTTEILTPKELLRELQALVVEAETMIANTASEQSDEAVNSLRARFVAAQERFEKAYAGVKGKVVVQARRADEYIRENPYQALAIAAGAALLVGLLVGRRGRATPTA